MANREDMICCCGASSWTSVIGSLQIIGSAIWLSIINSAMAGVKAQGEESQAVAFQIIGNIACIIGLILGALLLVGNHKMRSGFLWIWIVATGISTASNVIFQIVLAFLVTPAFLANVILILAINGFFIYVVRRRADEITTTVMAQTASVGEGKF